MAHEPVFDERRLPVAGLDGGDVVHLAVRETNPDGEGVPVLLVHGLASNTRLWDGVAARLAAVGHPVAAVDQRGHGRSDKVRTGYDWQTLTADLVAVMTGLGWLDHAAGPPLVAGQSWGGNVVVELVARHPDLVRAAALVDGGTIELVDRFADWPTAEAALTPPRLEAMGADRFEQLLRSNHPDWPEEGIAGVLANVEVLADGTVRPLLDRDLHMAIVRLLWDHHPSQRWTEIHVPVLLVAAEDTLDRGARFMAVKREEVARAERLLPRVATRWVAGDHDLHAQHPELLAALLHDAVTDPGFFVPAGASR